jgi:4-hydroxybenzoate polyprenyltransferase
MNWIRTEVGNGSANAIHSLDVDVPLFVDLDGTLLRTDLSIESVFFLLKQKPWMLLALGYWLILGKARLKKEIADRTILDFGALPIQKEFVVYLHDQAREGRTLYLATASDVHLAAPMADRFGIFKDVLASDGHRNLKGHRKLDAILVCCDGSPFDYAGNARADLAIWSQAREAIVVNPDAGVLASLEREGRKVTHVFDDRPPWAKTWLRALRVHQWAKNVLIGVPIVTAHAFTLAAISEAAFAFVSFGLIASATYVLNDLLDLVEDRHHPRKCKRPLAAGDIGLASGLGALTVMMTAGFAIAAGLSKPFLLTVAAYLILTVSYSLYFKKIALIDVLLLTSLYTMRIVAGAFAIGVELSSWLLAFSMFVFLSLALIKRCTELQAMKRISRNTMEGRGYHISDYPALSAMGVAAGYCSILVLALFISSPSGVGKYTHPNYLWMLCPLMTYWISRLWLKTSRGEMLDDPLIFSLKDRSSWIVFFNMIAVVLISL